MMIPSCPELEHSGRRRHPRMVFLHDVWVSDFETNFTELTELCSQLSNTAGLLCCCVAESCCATQQDFD